MRSPSVGLGSRTILRAGRSPVIAYRSNGLSSSGATIRTLRSANTQQKPCLPPTRRLMHPHWRDTAPVLQFREASVTAPTNNASAGHRRVIRLQACAPIPRTAHHITRGVGCQAGRMFLKVQPLPIPHRDRRHRPRS